LRSFAPDRPAVQPFNPTENPMKLYMHPVSMVSRPVRLFIAENKLPVDEQVVDIMVGEHYGEPFTGINPSRQVPVLEEGDFRMTESSAILKYLADKFDLPSYPKNLEKRAKVNEIMDWVNTGFYRDFGYGMVYPQLFPHHKRRSDEAQEATVTWGKERAAYWLSVLDTHYIKGNQFLCGDEITIADYFASGPVTLGELVGCDFSKYPNVARWIGNMKKLPNWAKTNEVFDGYAASLQDKIKDKAFVAV
jgi:glutathione S-transferase